ncbi:transglycosylase domain-containing protein [Corynebacterium sp. CNCTC7651]|uniref:transglycosylase domain-containing protein n=1 Tax=Corynebacterium sp. CNCTC7651 TaxID=2815361 RepID=UPI001F3A843A|nr:transglycosylase domain-containing protein [Corynebacterium sp. CNCTC7651]UIZ92310.1 transglycosylase domain-containing protein [Corynebacterium sp. CNCTC7651]
MSAVRSLGNLLAAVVAAGIAIALCIAPIAGLGGMAVARTNETMQSNLSDMSGGDVPGVTTITDINGEPMAWIYSQRRYEIASEDISEHVKHALVSTEDRRFYEHEGVDMQGFARAMVTNILAGGVEQGASTINQQYVKNYLWLIEAEDDEAARAATEQSIPRKLREMRMASDLDKTLEKDQILTRYLNLVSFGNHAYGIEAAAQTYYGIPARDLNPAQAALLVGLLQSVEWLNPYTNPEGATERRDTVLANMASEGYLPQEEAERAMAEPLGVLEQPALLPDGCITAGDNGFFCDYALGYLADKGLPQEEIERGSYTITTTLDPQVQRATVDAVRRGVAPETHGVAQVMDVVRPGTDSRDISAMATSRYYGLDLEQSQTIMPQPASLVGNGAGSVFKIFTAAAALEQGYGLDTMLEVPARSVVYGMGKGGAEDCPPDAYCVENAGTYAPRMTLRDALAHSPNTTFIELMQQVGVAPTVDLAVRLGLRSYLNEGSFGDGRSIATAAKEENMGAFTLGPLAVNALELANVGATLASGGRWCEPNPIASVTDKHGQQVYIDRPACEQAIDPEIAAALANGMSQDTIDGTGARAAAANGWTAPIAAKTGTTESHQSSAFLGFSLGMSAASYIFNDGVQTAPLCGGPVRQCVNGDLFGGAEAANTWFQAAARIPGSAAGLPPSAAAYNQGTRRAMLDETIGMASAAARASLEAQGFTVTVNTVFGDGAPAGTVVSAIPSDPNLSRGSVITLNVSDGSPGSTTATSTTATTTAPTSPGAAPSGEPSPTGEPQPEPEPGADLGDIQRQFNDMANGLAGLLNNG